jgi:hypothetical protein
VNHRQKAGLQTGLAVGVGLATSDLVRGTADSAGQSTAVLLGYVAAAVAAGAVHWLIGRLFRSSESIREGPVSRH